MTFRDMYVVFEGEVCIFEGEWLLYKGDMDSVPFDYFYRYIGSIHNADDGTMIISIEAE